MSFYKASIIAALVATVSALSVTSPAKDAQVDLSKSTKVSWSSVSSDPSSFSIVLVNQHVNPSVSINIADNVQTSSGSFDVPAQSGLANGGNYQFNLVSKTPMNEGILAQSQQFAITASGTSSSSSSAASSSAASSSSSAAAGTSSSLSSSSSSASASASSASASISSAASSASGAASSALSSVSASASSVAASVSSAASSVRSATSSAATPTGNAAASLHIVSGAAGLGFVGAAVALFA